MLVVMVDETISAEDGTSILLDSTITEEDSTGVVVGRISGVWTGVVGTCCENEVS